MKDIDTITNIMNQLFPKETVVETLLLKGGMSNSTYVVFTKNNKYTIRIPNAYSHLFTNWKREKTIYDSLSLSPLIPKLYYYSVESGIKVSQYVESVKPIEEVSYDEILSFLEEVQVQLIPKCNYESCFYRLDLFESYIDKNNIAGMNFKDYEIYKKYLVDHQGFIAPRQIVFCHGDFQPSNLIYTNGGLKMLDL